MPPWALTVGVAVGDGDEVPVSHMPTPLTGDESLDTHRRSLLMGEATRDPGAGTPAEGFW